MKNLYIVFFLILSGGLYAQNNLENANWIFGSPNWIDFNNNSLILKTLPSYASGVSERYFVSEGCASVSDEDGNLLFFTDGYTVFRIINNEVYSIDYQSGVNRLPGGFSSSQNTIIVQRPNWEGRYYLISIVGATSSNETRGLYWSEFDSNTNQFISVRNVMSDGMTIFDPTFNNSTESITSCIAANGVDMWVIAHMQNDSYSRMLSYSVTAGGITAIPVTLDVALPNYWSHSLKISSDTQRLALGRRGSNPLVGTFNNTTGAMTLNLTPVGDISMGTNAMIYSVEFSPDSQMLYFSRFKLFSSSSPGIFAVDLSNPSVETPIYSLGVNSILSTLQRGLNDNIYVVQDGMNTILEITNPNSHNSWSTGNLPLVRYSFTQGLPQWIWPTCKNTTTLTSPNNDINGTNSRRERSEWIKASNQISASTTTKVVYHAGNFLELKPGFEAKFGARVSAYVEGCTNDYLYKNNSVTVINPEKSITVNKTFMISPNPSESYIDLNIQNDTFNRVVIAAIDGKIILDKAIETTTSYNLDISRYASGVYIVNVISYSGKQYSQKLIKE